MYCPRGWWFFHSLILNSRGCIDILCTEFIGKNRKCLGVRSLVLSKCLGRGGGELEEFLEHMNVCIFNKGLFFEHWL